MATALVGTYIWNVSGSVEVDIVTMMEERMGPMTSKERVAATLARKPVDRLAASESFWHETVDRWRAEGHVGPQESIEDHFDLDIRCAGWPHMVADLDFEPVVLEETDETILRLDGNGAKLRWMKNKGNAPEHVDFTVKDRTGWLDVKPKLARYDSRRAPLKEYVGAREAAAKSDRFFCWHGIAPFECMHLLCGHEHMLMGMAMDPEWVSDMVNTYAELTIQIMSELFEKGGKPDGVWFYEDMGFKERPFMSPDMYRALVMPGHKKLFDFAHSQGLPVIVHSCGFVEPLLEGLIEAGMDCLQAMEVKAGMDVLELSRRYGDRISFCGNLDIRELISNDTGRVDAEMDRKIPALLGAGRGYIVHSDHSVPADVNYESMVHWYAKARSYRTNGRS